MNVNQMSPAMKLHLLIYAFVFCLFSCQTLHEVPQQEDLIVGTWILKSASMNGQEIPADKMGGKISFVFTEDGVAVFTTPEGATEKGRYSIKENQLIDPDSPGNPAEIITLTKDQFVMAMDGKDEKVVMNFVPERR